MRKRRKVSLASSSAKDILRIFEHKTIEFDGVNKLLAAQKSLHIPLKIEISKLCQTLNLPEDVEREVEKFLEYIMDNHLVISEPATTTILQAFQLSLCWIAASLLGNKIERKESYAIAKKHLSFDCNKQEIYLLHSRLRCLKKIFSNHLKSYKVPESSFASESMNNVLSDYQFQKVVVKGIKKIQKTCLKKFEKLKQKQQEEKDEFDRTCEEKKSQMCKQRQMESAVIRSCFHSNFFMRKCRLQKLENEYAKKLEEHNCQMEILHKKLEEKHLDAKNKMVEWEANWVETLTSWLHLNKQILNETRQRRNSLLMTEQTTEDVENAALNTLGSAGPSAAEFEDCNKSNSSEDIEENVTFEDPFSADKEPDGAILSNPDGEVSKGTSNRYSASGVDIVSVNLLTSDKQISHSDIEVPQRLAETVSSIEGAERVLTACLLPSAEGMENETTKDPVSEILSQMHDPVNSNLCVDDVYSNLVTSPCGSSLPIDEVQRSVQQTVIPVDVREILPIDPPLSKELILNRSTLSASEVEISLKKHTSASCESLEGDSSNSQNDGKDHSESGNPCVVDHQDTTDNTNLEVNSHELSVNLPPVQLSVTSTKGSTTLLCNQAAHDKMNLQSTSTGSMVEIIPATDQSNQEAQLRELQTQMVPLLTTDSSVGCFQTDLSSAGRMESHMDREEHPSDQLAQTTMQPIENLLEPINGVSSQPVTCPAPHCSSNVAFSDTRTSSLDIRTVPATLDTNNGFMQPTQPIVSQAPFALYIDPLQKELERMLTEIDQTIDIYAQKKLQLKSECEKEIEEVIAQIDRKYENKLQESETEFDLRKKELDAIYNKVYMNKILAEAFMCKYIDPKACDIRSCSAPQMFPPPLLQNIIMPSLVGRPSFAGLSTVSLHTSNAPSIDIQRTTTVANVPSSLPASSQSTGSTSTHEHHSSTHFSSNPMRPPGRHINYISSPSGNLQIGSAIRAPAPHLQPFRLSEANPHCMPSQHGPNNPSATSPSFPQPPPRLPISAALQSIPSNRIHQPMSLEHRPTLFNPSLSALDLLIDMNSRAGVNIPVSSLSPAADLSSSQHQPVSPIGTGGMPVKAVHTTVGSDVVCLSDDD